MEKGQENINSPYSDKLILLANQIFTAFPQEVIGLKLYVLDCGCIYYQRVFRDGDLDSQIGVYRDAEHGPCEIYTHLDKDWKHRVSHETVVYTTKVKVLH